jgi:translocation and assembly module TamA
MISMMPYQLIFGGWWSEPSDMILNTKRVLITWGQALAIVSAEYNYEFRPGFRGAIFSDVGSAYDKDFSNETNVGVGVGIRWASPVGVVRVDVAAGVTEESVPIKLHFFIGSPL